MATVRPFSILYRIGHVGVLAVYCLTPLSRPGQAQDSLDCGKGVELRLSSSESFQGSLLLVEVQSASSLGELKAEWVGHTLFFWQDANHENLRRALLGVDIQRSAGQYPLTLAAQLESGESANCNALISVKAGRFATERLRVPRKFVEPSPRDLERSEQERQRLEELFARVTPERLWQGGFQLPVEGTRAAGNFGRRRFLNGQPRAPHSGEDFPAAAGTPVHAAQRGRVVLAEELFFSGNTVVLDHGLGLFTLYYHLESIAVAAGEVVAAGTIVGRVGATGRVTGPHLHWAVRLGEARVSPLALVALPAD